MARVKDIIELKDTKFLMLYQNSCNNRSFGYNHFVSEKMICRSTMTSKIVNLILSSS